MRVLFSVLYVISVYRYMEANKKCKEAENVIECESTNVQTLAIDVEESFEKVAIVTSVLALLTYLLI